MSSELMSSDQSSGAQSAALRLIRDIKPATHRRPRRAPQGLYFYTLLDGTCSRISCCTCNWSAPKAVRMIVKEQHWHDHQRLLLSHLCAGDQDAITVVAQLLWAAGLDVVVLQGLAGPGAAAKVCALLNLWDASNGAGEKGWGQRD